METNAAVVQSAYAAFGRGDIGTVLGLVADDVSWTSPRTLPQGGEFKGRDGVGQFFQAVGGGWSALTLDVECVTEGPNGIVIGVVRGQGTRSTGAPAGYGAVHVFTVSDGAITRFREFTDLDGPLA